MASYHCETCGVSVERFPSVVKRAAGRVFCSSVCAAQRQQRTGITTPCAWCGNAVYRKPSEVRAAAYCSRSCSNRAQSAVLRAHPELRTSKGSAVVCEQCGQTFYVKPFRAKRARYCSKTCFFASRYGQARGTSGRSQTGDTNPNYRGTNNSVTARQTARRLHGDGGWACMVCDWDVAVDIHHVTPKHAGGTNDPENLAVLCPNHHRMAHLGLLTQGELTTRVLAAIAARSDHPHRSDPQSPDPP